MAAVAAAADPATARALQLCREHVAGWQQLDAADFECTPVTGGLTNLLYKCTNKAATQDPPTVLLRIYAANIEDMCPRVQDVATFALLSERGRAPSLHGVFTEGRIEGFIDGTNLKRRDLADPAKSATIARKLAGLHMEHMPLRKVSGWCIRTMQTMVASVRAMPAFESERFTQMITRNFSHDVSEMEKLFAACAPDIVFCHNDLQENNILQSSDGALHFIDFEYVSYNHSAFDIANHFIEWSYDYTCGAHGFEHFPDQFPTEEQQRAFIGHYLEVRRGRTPTADEIEALRVDVVRFQLASHYLWGLWGLMNSQSPIAFGYLAYAASRFEAFDRHMELARAKYWPK